jgi:hypothetical protein
MLARLRGGRPRFPSAVARAAGHCLRHLGVIAVFSASISVVSACNSGCDTSDDGNPPERYLGGVIIDGVYWSAPYGSEWLHFPGGKRYEIVHHLGVCPVAWPQCTISFAAGGVGPTFNGNTATTASGNVCEIQQVNEDSVIIKNATCSEFWVLVTVDGRNGTFLCDGGVAPLADASADGGLPSDESEPSAEAGPDASSD